MAGGGARIVASISIGALAILVVILWVFLGRSRSFFIITGIDLSIILAILIWALVREVSLQQDERRRRSMVRRRVAVEKDGEELRLQYSFLRKVAGLPTKFGYESLSAATDGFQSLVGRGSSGSVFKGILDDGTPVAVKRIEGSENGDREFRSEVSAIGSVQHVNLVRLLGYCIVPGGARFLVYDFVHNGSLDKWIFPSSKTTTTTTARRGCLPWELRYRAAIDVGRALAYLHHDCRSRVLHLDVKPENILLDGSFRAMVSDFGLSKLMGRDESRVVTTIRGTRGYLAPEWFMGRGVSQTCDVYSYGMVLLEMLGGRRSVRLLGEGENKSWSYFPLIVMEKVKEGRLMELVDERLLLAGGGGVVEAEVRILVYVALWCIRESAQQRPSMARVLEMLHGRMPVDPPPPETDTLILDLLSIDHQPLNAATAAAPLPMSDTHSFKMSTLLSGR